MSNKYSRNNVPLRVIDGEQILLDRFSTQEMLLYNALDHLGVCVAVPVPTGVDQQDGAVLTDAQAVRLGTQDSRFPPVQSKLLQPPFEVVPGYEPLPFIAANRLGLIRAQKYMPAVRIEPKPLYNRAERVRHRITSHEHSLTDRSPGTGA